MQPYPLFFRPVLKQTIWGGRRLGQQLGKPIGDHSNYAESWDIVDHGVDQSVVVNGELAGQTLADVTRDHARWLLGQTDSPKPFPLLLKYLDCNRVLSVQVHPDDGYAQKMEKPDLGKTEAWYIVTSDPEALIYAGLEEGVDRETLREAIDAGQTEQVLHKFHPQPGEIVFIPAGTVHALGAGLVVAEIQQSSDATFRLFDWNRVDDSGNSRPLHIEPSLEVTDYSRGPITPIRSDPLRPGWQTMVACEKFVLRVLRAGQDSIGDDGKFHLVTVPSGRATLAVGDEMMLLDTGTTLLLPAAMGRCQVSVAESGGAVLASHLPD